MDPSAPTGRRSRARLRLARVFIVGAAVLSACDDDGTQQPADTVTGEDSVTTVPVETPSGGSGQVEPGTNLTPSSDDVPDPSGSAVPGLGDTTQATGG